MSVEEEGSPLRLDRAEFDAPQAGAVCAFCHQPIETEYFEVNGRCSCGNCRAQVERVLVSREGAVERFLTALGLGILGGVAGTLLWYAVLAYLHLESGLVAIGVGLLVGLAVKRGARGRGGWPYQALGMALTYGAIAASYGLILTRRYDYPLFQLIGAGLAAPLRGGAANLLGYAIIAIALWEPWRLNRRAPLRITGPYRLGGG